MRRMLLATAAALALSAGPAVAQALVHDAGSNLARIVEATRALQQAVQQYRMLVNTYNALSHATDVSGVSAGLGGAARTFMPAAGQVAGLIAGDGSSFGDAAAMLGQSRLADVGNESSWAQEMQRRELATANVRAMAMSGLQASQGSLAGLVALLERISSAQDVTEVEAVNGAIAVEQQNISRHQEQVAQLQLMLHTEDRVERQRAEQEQWRSARELRELTAGSLGAVQ